MVSTTILRYTGGGVISPSNGKVYDASNNIWCPGWETSLILYNYGKDWGSFLDIQNSVGANSSWTGKMTTKPIQLSKFNTLYVTASGNSVVSVYIAKTGGNFNSFIQNQKNLMWEACKTQPETKIIDLQAIDNIGDYLYLFFGITRGSNINWTGEVINNQGNFNCHKTGTTGQFENMNIYYHKIWLV